MATAEEYASWIVNNQDKKGTPEFETVAQAYKVAKAPKQEEINTDPTAGMSRFEKVMAGMGRGATEVGRGLGQVFGMVSPQDVAEARKVDAPLMSTPEGQVGDIAGNLAVTMVPGLAAGRAAMAGAKALGASAKVAPTLAAAASGGLVGGLTSTVAPDESRLGAAAINALGGAGGDLAARGVARVAQPIMQSDTVKRLLAEGIVPTPGQAAGSVVGKTEDKLTSVLGVGDIIQSGRDRARNEFNAAALNRMAPAGVSKITQGGAEGFSQLEEALSKNYDKIYAGKTVKPNGVLFQAIGDAKNIPTLPLNETAQKDFDGVIKKIFLQRIPANGQMPADEVKAQIVGDLGKEARKLLNSPIRSESSLGEALMAARDAVQNWLKSEVAKTSPLAASQIASLDKAYSQKFALEKAVEKAKANGGVFTPFQLQTATKDGQPLRALANDAQSVLGSRVANSGSVDRALAAAALGVGAGGANEYFGGPGYLTALALSPLAYSRTGARYAVGDLIPGQQALSSLIRSSAPATAQAGRSLADLNR